MPSEEMNIKLSPELEALEERLLTIPEGFTVRQAVLFLDRLGLNEGDTYLDMFAGTGALAMVAATRGIQSINIDNNVKHNRLFEQNTHILRELYPDIVLPEIIFGDSRTIELGPLTYDAIITSPPFTLSTTENPPEDLSEYFTYMAEVEAIFRRFKGNLKKGGQVLLEIGNDALYGIEIKLKEQFVGMMIRAGFEIITLVPRIDSEVGSYYGIFKKSLIGANTQRLLIQQNTPLIPPEG